MKNIKRIDAEVLQSHDVLFITLDTLRYDVAQHEYEAGNLPRLSKFLPPQGWELRHSPGSFTYAAHQAFFAGFLPTPVTAGPHERLFALAFPGSETIGKNTIVFNSANIVDGFKLAGYHTVCIGGVGFFNKRTPLGNTLPSLFDESHWDESLGVSCKDSTRNQVRLALDIVDKLSPRQRYFLFINISALHQPNCHYLPGNATDSIHTQAAALRYVDEQLEPLLRHCEQRAPTLLVICSDHGTCYGEQGFYGHRLAHEVVWKVPYAQALL